MFYAPYDAMQWARHALESARYSRMIGDRADAAYWLTLAANARLEVRAIRVAYRRVAERGA